MGEVYEALHTFTKKPVALKVLKLAHTTKTHLVEKMRTEAMVLCRVKHANLVEVYDAGIVPHGGGQMIWMAMELLEGESLRERLSRESSVPPRLAFGWASQVATGLQVVHDAQVVHRDLKPENIFVTKRGEIRVLDFGTAKFGFQEQHSAVNDRMGTLPYMSPEHISNTDVDHRTDMYALGLILYEMLAGMHPFADPQTRMLPALDLLIGMHLAGEPAALTSFGPAAWQVIQRAIAKEPEARFTSMTEMADALTQLHMQLTADDSAVLQSGAQRSGAELAGREGSSVHHAHATPGPMTAGVVAPQLGIGRGMLLLMALLVAALSAAIVMLLSWRGDDAETTSAANTAAPTATAEPSRLPASGRESQGASSSNDPSAPPTSPVTPPQVAASATTTAAPVVTKYKSRKWSKPVKKPEKEVF